ncbi:MAG: AAA family ATPase, partial [Candidatus Kariarchaeaceae archaeon]
MVLSIVAIGGPHGSGKSSVARKLAENLNMNYVSAGSIFRELANERKISLEEFSSTVL